MRISFIFIILLALALRLINIGKFALNTDEKFTLVNIHGICVGGYNQQNLFTEETFTPSDFWQDRSIEDYYQAVARADFGTHITHNTLLHYWVKVFGKSDTGLRLMGILFSMLTLILVYWFCKDLLGSSNTGLWAMFLLAIDPLLVSQAHFARSYNLSFFLLVLASYLFLKILRSPKVDKRLVIGYAIIASLSLLNHYLNFVVLLCHVIVAVVYLREQKKWLYLVGAGAFTLGVMAYWMLAGGGQWSMQFLEDKNALHLALSKLPAAENPMKGIVDPSSLANVVKKAMPIFFDANAISFDFYKSLNGVRNTSIYLVIVVVAVFTLIRFRGKQKEILTGGSILAIVLGFTFFNGFNVTLPLRSLLFVGVVYSLSQVAISKREKLFLVLASILPLLYVVFDAFKSGHTTSLSHRYIGNSIPFLGIFIAIGLNGLMTKSKTSQAFFAFLFVLQMVPVGKELSTILRDQSGRYSFREISRISNPYYEIAQEVKANYAEGDTLLLPSYDGNVYSGHLKEAEKQISILDAQYLNVYFEKSDPFVQKIDRTEPNKVILQKADGEKIELFDFENNKYRY